MQYNKKWCPAIVGIYYFVDDIKSTKEISEKTGIPTSSVHEILKRKYNATEKREKATRSKLDAIEREYLDGATTYELADKYGVYHTTITKWMAKRGHRRGRGYQSPRSDVGPGPISPEKAEKRRRKAFEHFIGRLESTTGGSVEYVSGWDGKSSLVSLLCAECGQEFEMRAYLGNKFRCPHCFEREVAERKAQREHERNMAEALRRAEFEKVKTCEWCGAEFHSENISAKFCSKKCKTKKKISEQGKREREQTAARQARELQRDKICRGCGSVFHSTNCDRVYCDRCQHLVSGCDHRIRARLHGVEYDSSVKLKPLINRDNNICQICGEPCDEDDLTWGNFGPRYPSIDHIRPMSKGGSHTWDNVQLAHVICNSIKSDKLEVRHAEEQAIAHE